MLLTSNPTSLDYRRPQPSNGSGGGGQGAGSIDAPAPSDPSAMWVLPHPLSLPGIPYQLSSSTKCSHSLSSSATKALERFRTIQQAADLLVISKVMPQNRYSKLVVVSPTRMSDGKLEGAILNNLFQILGIMHWQPLPQRVYGRDYLFLLGILGHLAATARGEGIPVNSQFSVPLRALLIDYPVMSVPAMVEKYRLGVGSLSSL